MIKLPVPRHEMIDCESWYKMADYHYEPLRIDFPSGIVHVDMGSIPEFFRKIQHRKEKYVVISSRSDFGLHYQKDYPPWKDYAKFAQQVIRAENTNGGYEDIVLPSPINRGKCYQSDKYSIKCYRYTHATFNFIPENVVKWFITNNTILDDERIVSIPFGINGVDGNSEPGDKIYARMCSSNVDGDRMSKVYVNFQFYTNERVRLFDLYKSNGRDCATVEKDVPFEHFLNQLLCHNCCLCPPSNGWDSYRIFESLYMGCIPIIELNDACRFYCEKMDLPIVFVNSLESITPSVLEDIKYSWMNNRKDWDLIHATVSYWKNIIEENRSLLWKC